MRQKIVVPDVWVDPAKTTATAVILEPAEKQKAETSKERSGLSWSDWFNQALSRLMQEEPAEVKSLIKTLPPASKEQSDRLNFRLYARDLANVRDLAKQHGVPARNVMVTAMSLQSIRVSSQLLPGTAGEELTHDKDTGAEQ